MYFLFLVGLYRGYMAPEYAIHGHLSTKSDVYSFGITLLEIASGRKIFDITVDGRMLIQHAWRLYEKDWLHELIDPRLLSTDGLIYSSSVSRTVKIGLCCIHNDYARRPSVSRVLAMLLSEEEIPNLNREDEPFSDLRYMIGESIHTDMLSGESVDSSYVRGESFHTDMLNEESCEY
ncbi:cysteine-rich receptor-like protein kinase 8 [Cryptomeria japonica]|uniref:cysteine-rich receptor-like protein kinase 8 n=1 Tax=Cryptomeria japonica TaxID=3369 RepID=UPI0027D9CED5|nr:cysteine-rich receptor-like protein kinase 8 [Cryptomeria japonica]